MEGTSEIKSQLLLRKMLHGPSIKREIRWLVSVKLDSRWIILLALAGQELGLGFRVRVPTQYLDFGSVM